MARQSALSSKVIVTNRAVLLAKYGPAGTKAIDGAVRALVAADRKRGFATRLFDLGSAALGKARVRDPSDPTENKAAIDAVARKHRPEYLVILGAHDVVPFQDLKNKLHDPADPDSDPDRFAGSDLPYACEAPYSQDVTKFLGPTRVVGRIPDLTGATSPAYLLARLRQSAVAKSTLRPTDAFALSAKVWVKSTKMSVRNILGAVPLVHSAPRAGPKFTRAQLGAKVHFVNCHGNQVDHTFSGEGPEDHYTTALDARKLDGLAAGTVAAFECCYGAELYDPRGLPAMSIANAYLAKGALGLVAATTIAYGPADDNANADVICQLFLEHVLRGASLGRAFLEARLAYVRQQSVVDPYDEKTLAQFVLLGDPALHPFAATPAGAAPTPPAVKHAARLQRRVRLMKAGQQLARDAAYTVPARRGARAALQAPALAAARKRFKHVRVFAVHESAATKRAAGKALARMPKAQRVFVATQRRRPGDRQAPLEGLLAYQVDGSVVQMTLHSR
jgi:hypothetical protein